MLEVKGLNKSFEEKKILKNISLEIYPGKINGLLGPNGAGKSTLIRCLLGLYKFNEGRVLWNNQKFDFESHQSLIGYMPEERGLFRKMKSSNQIIYLARLKGLSKMDAIERTRKWFEKFEIQSWWNKNTEELSKGMSQKLQFIATVVHDPELLVLDEPFSGLDPRNAELIKSEIQLLAQQGKLVLLSTHRMEQVEEMCDHITLISQGEVMLDSTVKDAKQTYSLGKVIVNFEHPKVANDVYDKWLTDYDAENYQAVFTLKNEISKSQLLKHLIGNGNEIKEFREVYPSMSDIFIQLTSD